MAWIKSDSELSRSPKFFDLASRLKVTPERAFWNLHHFWYWCCDQFPDGVMKDISDLAIAHSAQWQGEPKTFVDALVISGFVDREVGHLRIHDWEQWKPNPVRMKDWRERRANIARTSNGVRKRGARESLSVDSKDLSLKTTTTEATTEAVTGLQVTEKPKPAHVEFMERFKAFYESVTAAPFKWDGKDFILVQRLMKNYGVKALIEKAKTLAVMCRNRSAWFTKDGYASFSIAKISTQWNAIIPEAIKDTDEQETAAIKAKWRDHDERVSKILGR